jgi:glycosyltransferase involved in cell wall biosynthesis
VVHNGVDAARFSPSRAAASLRGELGIDERAPVLGFAGRISPEKGIALLVEASRRLRQIMPEVRVIVAGDSGYRAQLERSCVEAGLANTVKLLGFVREVERVYATADVMASPSTADGCPNAILEAMAMGRAVVATRVGGTAEIVRHGVDGVLVEPGDAAAFVDEAALLLGSPLRRAELGGAAARAVRERFSAEGQAARLAAILRWATAELELPEVVRRRVASDGVG